MTKTKLIPGKRYYLFTKEATGIYCFTGGQTGLVYFKNITGMLNMWPDTNGYYGFIIDPTAGEVPEPPKRVIEFELDINWN